MLEVAFKSLNASNSTLTFQREPSLATVAKLSETLMPPVFRLAFQMPEEIPALATEIRSIPQRLGRYAPKVFVESRPASCKSSSSLSGKRPVHL